jgi:hypothetical protein
MMIHDWQPRSRLMQKAPPPSILMGTGASERSIARREHLCGSQSAPEQGRKGRSSALNPPSS